MFVLKPHLNVNSYIKLYFEAFWIFSDNSTNFLENYRSEEQAGNGPCRRPSSKRAKCLKYSGAKEIAGGVPLKLENSFF